MGAIPFLTQIEPESKRYVGAYIKNLRLRLGLTQLQLSFSSGYSVVTISRIENGKANASGVAGRDILIILSELCGFTEPGEMLDDYISFVRDGAEAIEVLQ